MQELTPLTSAKLGRPMDASIITPDYYALHYEEFIPMYISRGRPSADTLSTYTSSINQFLRWCRSSNAHPLYLRDYQLRMYQQILTDNGYKDDSIAVKIIAVRLFYEVAFKLQLIPENPCKHISTSSSFSQDEMIKYYTNEQIQALCDFFKDEEDDFVRLRGTLAVYLMAVEGLRCVEVHRANREDINFELGIMQIHGKGHGRQIYPCAETLNVINDYINACPNMSQIGREGNFTPLFLSNAKFTRYKRISRDGLRYILNKALRACGIKIEGESCHILRHSCGTNLYAAKKDLRLVQDVLGHRDPKTTARYAHLSNRLTNRDTASIAPK
ncbi:MAG: tyrosine-type recombinase/integrase [Selenomonadaceae bacterium]|nr:tyrosine-type recombinase/integrase [Selenomonadaceae bacterium]